MKYTRKEALQQPYSLDTKPGKELANLFLRRLGYDNLRTTMSNANECLVFEIPLNHSLNSRELLDQYN